MALPSSGLISFAAFATFASPLLASEPVPVDQLPPPVVEKLRKTFADAPILSAESETRNDYIYYFVKIRREDRVQLVTINEYGAISETANAPGEKPASSE